MHPPCPDKRRRSIDRGLLLSTISLALLSSPTPLYGQSPTYSQAPATAERSLNDLPGDMLPGVAQPLQFAELAPPVDGVVASIGIEEGQLVTANQLLLTIDNRIAKASYAVAKVTAEKTASLEAARAKVVLAEQYLQRIEQAYQKQAASGLELDEAKSRLREAKAALAEGLEVQHEAEVRLDLERQRLEAHELHAPFAGVVTRINKQPGEAATRDQHLITLANLSRLRVELFIPLTELAHLHVGDAIALQADAPSIAY